MKRLFTLPTALLCTFALSACSSIGNKSISLTPIYAVTLFLAFVMLICHCCSKRRNDHCYTLLFSSIFTANLGYLLLAISPSLSMALWANRIAYLGSVFLPFSMLMIILNITKLKYKRVVPYILVAVSVIIFLIAASPGVLDIYYKEVSLVKIDGVSALEKVYGPWHSIYLFFLLGYFVAMFGAILHSIIKRTAFTRAYSFLLLGAAGVNICVWLLEQLSNINFEFLSVSYIISELFLLGLSAMMNENEKRIAAINAEASRHTKQGKVTLTEYHEYFIASLPKLTAKEREVYELYLKGSSTREVMNALSINENTLKYHNRNIYSKLGVSSRRQLLEFAADIKAAGRFEA